MVLNRGDMLLWSGIDPDSVEVTQNFRGKGNKSKKILNVFNFRE